MPSPKTMQLKSYVTPEEYAAVATQARRAGLSLSTYVKTATLMRELRAFEHQEFRLELLKLRADLGRLGGLFKMVIQDKPVNHHRLVQLTNEIHKRQDELKETVRRLCSAKGSPAKPETTTTDASPATSPTPTTTAKSPS